MSVSERYGFWFPAVSIKEMIIILCTPTFLINSIRGNSDTESGFVDIDFYKGIDNYSRLISLICFKNRFLSTRRPMPWFIFIFFLLYFLPVILCIPEHVGINNLLQNKGKNSRFKSESSHQRPSCRVEQWYRAAQIITLKLSTLPCCFRNRNN